MTEMDNRNQTARKNIAIVLVEPFTDWSRKHVKKRNDAVTEYGDMRKILVPAEFL